MKRLLLAFFLALGVAAPARAAFVVLTNFTPDEVKVTITEAKRKPQTVTLAPFQVAPVAVAGPAEITFPAKPADATFRLDPYHAYVLIPDKKTGRQLQGVEMPGDPPEQDARPEPNPAPRTPVKVPVTLLVDDADPRTEQLWHATLRKRFDEAAAVIEAHAAVKPEFAGFDSWKSDPDARDLPALLDDFAAKVKVRPGGLVIGYTSRIHPDPKEPEKPVEYGAYRGFPTRHLLLREGAPRNDWEKVEVLIHHLGLALGATLTPDPGSVMRPEIADGLALRQDYRFRFDPLNVLAMNLWADELRRGPLGSVADASPANKLRLIRVYKALQKTRPGDSLAAAYLDELGRDMALNPVPKKEPPPAAKREPPAEMTARDEVARRVVRAVAARGRAATGPAALTGDALTAEYVKTAATAAMQEGLSAGPADRVGGFLLGLAVALDDSDALRAHPLTAGAAKLAESDAEREERLAVLGNPTIRGRRDLCRQFAVGCGTGELLSRPRAEEVALDRFVSPDARAKRAGLSFPALAAEFAGIALAQADHTSLDPVRRAAEKFTPGDYLPATDGLRDGLSVERFREDYADPGDPRFQAVLGDIRTRVRKLPRAK